MRHTLRVIGAAALAAVLVLGLASAAMAASWSDLPDSVTQQYGISGDQVAGISQGFEGGLWKPDLNVTRAQYVKMAMAAFALPTANPAAPTYADVATGDYYYSWVEGATVAGLTNGVGQGLFDPNGTTSREQAAAMAARQLAAAHGYDLTPQTGYYSEPRVAALLGEFSDGGAVSPSLRTAIAFAIDFDLMKGSEGKLDPQGLVNRIQGATFLIRAAGATVPPAFTPTDAEEEGYWYSRYNMGNLAMISGLGDTFMPDMDMMQMMIQMADANPADGDAAMPPMNAALLKSVYASGDPHYTQEIDMNDFGTQHWDPASFDTTVTSRAMGWLMIKEIEWAKQFHVDDHFGTPADDFGAQWRFVGSVINTEAMMQAQFAMQMLKNEQGLYANSDGFVDFGGQWVMLEALSDLGNTLAVDAQPHSATNRYKDAATSAMMLGGADMLFGALDGREPADLEEYSLAIQALTWYAATTTNVTNKAAAIAKIADFGDALAAMDTTTATENAFAVRGLIEAYRVGGDSAHLTAAAAAFNAMLADYDWSSGVFESQASYTIDDVGVILGAINSAKLFAGDAVDQDQAQALFTAFYLNAVNKSGLQQSVPPVTVGKDAFEQEEPPMYYGYPTIPMPPMAGGEFGVAPVFATEVTFSDGAWTVTDAMFDSAGAMHASNEFIWFHNDEVNGFPEIVQ